MKISNFKGKLSMLLFSLAVAVCIYINPPYGLTLAVMIVVHELGHYVVAKHYGVFLRFVLTPQGAGVEHIRPDTYKKHVDIAMAGYFFSLIPLIFGGIIFLTGSDFLWLGIIAVAASAYDIIGIFKIRDFYREKEKNDTKK